jgi:hypothetical protein
MRLYYPTLATTREITLPRLRLPAIFKKKPALPRFFRTEATLDAACATRFEVLEDRVSHLERHYCPDCGSLGKGGPA